MLATTIPAAHAWTHEINNWDVGNHSDYTCGYSSSVPCLYWQQPNGKSATYYTSLESNLTMSGYDFKPVVKQALTDYANAPALNPYINPCTDSFCDSHLSVIDYTMGALDSCVFAETDISQHTSPTLGHTPDGSSQWYALFNSSLVTFSTNITWNNSLTYSCTQADGRKVAHHETGHVEGLGHTGVTPAIMHQGAANYYTLQSNDINGLQSIYPGYYPA